MDGRQRLAQPTKPRFARRAPASAYAWPSAFGRWRRVAQRWLAPLLALDPPRGLGASAAALLLLASTCYGVVKGGHVDTIATEIHDICDVAANAAGFRISEVALAGQHEVSRETILALAGITGRSSLPFLNAARARARLLTNPWIVEASVLKLYPGRVRIAIKEREAFALWQKNGLVSLIASDGTELEPYAPPRFLSLPLLVGRGAEHRGRAFLAMVGRHPAIARRVESSVLVAERRWNLHLKNGVEVLLPEKDPERALMILADLDRSKKLLSRDIVTVDLRLADRVTVRLSDAAAAARAEAIEAAEKKKKAKGRGGEA
jgi:cell division protein FtsQ